MLHSFVYVDSLKVRMFRWELDGHRLDAQEEAFFEDVERLRRGGKWRKAALER